MKDFFARISQSPAWKRVRESTVFQEMVRSLPDQNTSQKLIALGVLAFLLGQITILKQTTRELRENLAVISKNEGIKLYNREEMKKVEIGDVFLEIPESWNNIIKGHLVSPTGAEKHFIASAGNEFALPYASEYALIVGVEQRGVHQSLEDFLRTTPVESDRLDPTPKNLVKITDNMFSTRREGIGTEIFRKVDDVVLVIFLYDNGDRIIDDLEQRIINSVGVIEKNTLFDYK